MEKIWPVRERTLTKPKNHHWNENAHHPSQIKIVGHYLWLFRVILFEVILQSHLKMLAAGFATDESTRTGYRSKWASVSVFWGTELPTRKALLLGLYTHRPTWISKSWIEITGYLPKVPNFDPQIPDYLPEYWSIWSVDHNRYRGCRDHDRKRTNRWRRRQRTAITLLIHQQLCHKLIM